jgi:hypothetical protein
MDCRVKPGNDDVEPERDPPRCIVSSDDVPSVGRRGSA